MLTGQNAFAFSDKIDTIEALKTIKKATNQLKIILKNSAIIFFNATHKNGSVIRMDKT